MESKVNKLIAPPEIHLTFTGKLAGETFCGVRRDEVGEYVRFHHPNPAALRLEEYRKQVCPVCLSIWDEAYE